MQLQGENIFLRTVFPSDADLLFKWENDKVNWQVSGTEKSFTEKEIKDFIINQKDIYLDKQLRLLICINSPLKKGDKGVVAVGCIDLFEFDERNSKAGIGVLIEEKHRKNGHASEALSVLIKYSFEILNLQELFCHISENNTASLKLFQKHKFILADKKEKICSFQLLNS